MNRSHIPPVKKASVDEKPNKKKIRILQVLLIVSSLMFTYGVAGVAYTLMSNHSHASFSVDLGKPVFTTIIPGSTNRTVANFTVRALNTGQSTLSNLFVNVTLDQHPNGTFTLNSQAPNGGDTQWILEGPFSLAANQAILFRFTLNDSGTFGYYDIDASVVQLS